MGKFKVQMVNKYTGAVEEDFVDDKIFDTEANAEEYVCYLGGCSAEGAEILEMSNPGDYEEDFGDEEKYEYIAVEID